MPRAKKQVEEAVYEVKKNTTKKKETKKEKEEVEVEIIEENNDAINDNNQKAFFFPRLISYIIDIIIISIAVSLISSIIPRDNNYDKYLEEFHSIQTNYMEKEITAEEYINRVSDVTYDLDHSSVPTTIIQIVFIIGYFVVLPYYNKGQTLGKKLMHIKIISNDGNELTLNNYLYRTIIINSLLADIIILGMVLFINRDLYYFSSFIVQGIQVVIVIVSVFMILFKKDGRGLHDRLAHTKVIMCD